MSSLKIIPKLLVPALSEVNISFAFSKLLPGLFITKSPDGTAVGVGESIAKPLHPNTPALVEPIY